MIQNITFIVIARNESFAIGKCLESIASLPLIDCEVICIDSDSIDNTLDIMKGYIGKIQNYIIIQCSGYLNSAVARNAGLKYATKEYIYFVDGDTQLESTFIPTALKILLTEQADLVTGQLMDIHYNDVDHKEMYRVSDRHRINETKQLYLSSGTFIVRTSLVKKVGLFDERFHRHQDMDYLLRSCRHGRFLGIPVLMGIKYTSADDDTRHWCRIKKLYPMLWGLLIRKNIDQPKFIVAIFKQNRGFLAGFVVYGLFIVGILATAFLSVDFLYVALAVSFMVISDLVWGALRNKNVLNCFLLHYLYVPLIVVGIFVSINNKRLPTTVKQISLS
jgi:glycosyltransferase involved in cell wall biosynthesis